MTGEPDSYTDDGTPIFKEDVPAKDTSPPWWLLLLLLLALLLNKRGKRK